MNEGNGNRKEGNKMAIRNIRELGDDILRKHCREVREVTPKIQELIDDMYDTCLLYTSSGTPCREPLFFLNIRTGKMRGMAVEHGIR